MLCLRALLQTASHTVRLCFSRDLRLARGSESHCGLTVSLTGDRRRRHTDCLYRPLPGLHPGDLGRRCRRPTPPPMPPSAPSVGGLPLAATTSGARAAGACSPKSLACLGGQPLQERNYTSQNAPRRRGQSVGRVCARRQDVGPRVPEPAAAALQLKRLGRPYTSRGPSPCRGTGCPGTQCCTNPRAPGCPAPEPVKTTPSSSPDCTAHPAPLEGCVLARTYEE